MSLIRIRLIPARIKCPTASAKLQEVFRPSPPTLRRRSTVLRNSAENCEFRIQIFPQVHNRGYIPASLTVVRRRPHRCYGPVFEVKLVAFVDQLVCTGYELQTIDMIELED